MSLKKSVAFHTLGCKLNFSETSTLSRQLEADGYRVPVLHVAAKYLRPALYDDTLTVVATIREKPLLRIKFEYQIFRGDELLVTGQSSHAFCDTKGQPTRPPPACGWSTCCRNAART